MAYHANKGYLGIRHRKSGRRGQQQSLRGNVCPARARHPNQCSGHPSQRFTRVIPRVGCPFHNCKSTNQLCMIGRSGGEGV